MINKAKFSDCNVMMPKGERCLKMKMEADNADHFEISEDISGLLPFLLLSHCKIPANFHGLTFNKFFICFHNIRGWSDIRMYRKRPLLDLLSLWDKDKNG